MSFPFDVIIMVSWIDSLFHQINEAQGGTSACPRNRNPVASSACQYPPLVQLFLWRASRVLDAWTRARRRVVQAAQATRSIFRSPCRVVYVRVSHLSSTFFSFSVFGIFLICKSRSDWQIKLVAVWILVSPQIRVFPQSKVIRMLAWNFLHNFRGGI